MKINSSREIKTGALIVIGFIIIFIAFFLIGDKEGLFAKKYQLNAEFLDVEGLTVGASVRLGGMKVGAVRKIGFSENGKERSIIVEMSIESSSFSKVRKDSEARLGSMGLLGDRTVDITVGSPDAEPLMPGGFVNTIESMKIGDIIAESGDPIKDIKVITRNAKEISWKVNYGEGSLAKIINDPRLYTNLDSLLILWSDISRKIGEGRGSLAELVNDPALYNNLSNFLDEFSQLMADINAGQGGLGRLAKDNEIYDHTDSLLISLNSTLEKINSGQGSLGQLVNNTELYHKLNSTLTSLDSLIVDIKQNPRRYVKLSIF